MLYEIPYLLLLHYLIVFHFTAAWLPWSRKGEGIGFLGLGIHIKIYLYLLSLLPYSSPLCLPT